MAAWISSTLWALLVANTNCISYNLKSFCRHTQSLLLSNFASLVDWLSWSGDGVYRKVMPSYDCKLKGGKFNGNCIAKGSVPSKMTELLRSSFFISVMVNGLFAMLAIATSPRLSLQASSILPSQSRWVSGRYTSVLQFTMNAMRFLLPPRNFIVRHSGVVGDCGCSFGVFRGSGCFGAMGCSGSGFL